MHDDHDPYRHYQAELVAAGLLVPSGVQGIYAFDGRFERIVAGLEALIGREGAWQKAQSLRFPPLLPRAVYRKLDHVRSFPDLLGSVHGFRGNEREHQAMLQEFEQDGNWTRHLEPAPVMLAPAGCYALYPTATGTLESGGRCVDLESYVFRHEPSDDPARMQIFRMREYVRIGTPEQALQHRDGWMPAMKAMLESMGLEAAIVPASDPFFGRGGNLMKAMQVEQALKYELVVPVASEDKPTAVGSCNYHQDYFGNTFDIRTADGAVAHSACVAFGIERITLALLKAHGVDIGAWPLPVRRLLGLADA